jgi:hypothetical protein
LARLARIDPQLLYPVKHRSAQAQAHNNANVLQHIHAIWVANKIWDIR